MRVGTRIKELCAALEGMGSATAAEIHQAVFPDLDVNSVRTYCSRSVGLGFATVDRSAYPMRFTIAECWQRFKAPQPAKQQRPVYVRPANPLFTAWSAAAPVPKASTGRPHTRRGTHARAHG